MFSDCTNKPDISLITHVSGVIRSLSQLTFLNMVHVRALNQTRVVELVVEFILVDILDRV